MINCVIDYTVLRGQNCQQIKCIKFELCREKPPESMAELVVRYRLNADGLLVKDLIAERDFLAQRLDFPEHLLQVLSWGDGSIVITYWILRDLLPFVELALCRENVREELIQHGVVDVYLDSHPSDHPGLVRFRDCFLAMEFALCQCSVPWYPFFHQCRWICHCRLCIVRNTEHYFVCHDSLQHPCIV